MVCWITTLLDRPPYELGTGHYLSSRGEGEGFSYVTMKFIRFLLKLCIIRLEEEGGGGGRKAMDFGCDTKIYLIPPLVLLHSYDSLSLTVNFL